MIQHSQCGPAAAETAQLWWTVASGHLVQLDFICWETLSVLHHVLFYLYIMAVGARQWRSGWCFCLTVSYQVVTEAGLPRVHDSDFLSVKIHASFGQVETLNWLLCIYHCMWPCDGLAHRPGCSPVSSPYNPGKGLSTKGRKPQL